MTATTADQIVHIPANLFRRAQEAAKRTGVSVEDFVRDRLNEAMGVELSPEDEAELRRRMQSARDGAPHIDENEIFALLDEQRAKYEAHD